MKTKSIAIFFVSIFICGCIYHWQAGIVMIKNTTQDSLLVVPQPFEGITDSILYEELFDKDYVGAEPYKITLPSARPKQAPDSAKMFLYFFKMDSVEKYQRLKQRDGIFKKTLIKKVILQINKVKDPLDTIYIK